MKYLQIAILVAAFLFIKITQQAAEGLEHASLNSTNSTNIPLQSIKVNNPVFFVRILLSK